jgi:hypothetical protein
VLLKTTDPDFNKPGKRYVNAVISLIYYLFIYFVVVVVACVRVFCFVIIICLVWVKAKKRHQLVNKKYPPKTKTPDIYNSQTY